MSTPYKSLKAIGGCICDVHRDQKHIIDDKLKLDFKLDEIAHRGRCN